MRLVANWLLGIEEESRFESRSPHWMFFLECETVWKLRWLGFFDALRLGPLSSFSKLSPPLPRNRLNCARFREYFSNNTHPSSPLSPNLFEDDVMSLRFPTRSLHLAVHCAILVALGGLPKCTCAQDLDLPSAIKAVQAADAKGEGQAEAVKAWKTLSQTPVSQLPLILAGMDDANPLATNWLRMASDAVSSQALAKKQALPQQALEEFLADTSHSPAGRVTAFELLAKVDTTAHKRLIPGKLDDPSMELRYMAVEMAVEKAEKLADDDKQKLAKDAYRRAFRSARNLKQAEQIAESLEKLGERPSLSTHFGFIMRWKLVAPFDNVDQKGFDVEYGPESDPKLDSYTGKESQVKWVDHTTKDSLGLVDLNDALARHKGAICYAYAEFISATERSCELRLGCINANKVWLNGELLISNHVYHAGRSMDQYRGSGKLKKGVNQILVKVCQNEQEEQWAQDWQFQLRVCDKLGTGLLSTDRPAFKAAANIPAAGAPAANATASK